MENKQNRMSPIIELVHRFTGVFSQTVIVFAIAGILIARYAPPTVYLSTLFTPDGKGLTHNGILQLAGCSIVIAAFSAVLILEFFQTKLHYFFRSFIVFLSTLATTSIFAIVCKWYPFSNIQSWLLFWGFITAGFVVMHSFVMIKLKLEGIKYNRLLKNYKARRKNNLSHSE
jgi:hypothetical protein